jgi:sortase A
VLDLDAFPVTVEYMTVHSATPPYVGQPFVVPSRWPRRIIAMCSVVLITFGVFTVATIGWEQWGSAWYAARAQQALSAELAATASDAPTPAAPDVQPVRIPAPGEPLARITAPAAGIDEVVVVGAGDDALRKGPGWMPQTSLPGSPGNAVVSGHRTTYGAPFADLDRLGVGDRIVVSRPGATDAVFEVRATFVVEPTDVWVADQTSGVRLTLLTCTPKGSNRQRLVVQAELVEGELAAVATPAAQWVPSSRP